MMGAAPDGLLTVMVERETAREMRAVEPPRVRAGQTAQTQYAVVVLDPLIERAQFVDQTVARQRRFFQFEHDAVDEVLVERRRDACGQRLCFRIAWPALPDAHEQPVRSTLNV